MTKPRLALGLAVFVVSAGVLTLNGQDPSGARGWELRTSYQRVAGAEQLEAGNLDGAIATLVSRYESNPEKDAAPILTNLCLAFLLKRELVAADRFCELALAQPGFSRDAYNNRGVLQALRGNYPGAIEDCPDGLADASHSPDPVSVRNLNRAQQQLTAMLENHQRR